MYLLDVSIRDLKYFCVLFVLFVFLFLLLALLRCYTSIFDGFITIFHGGSAVFITILHGGSAGFITILHGGGGGPQIVLRNI